MQKNKSLIRDTRGATIAEFALIAPAACLMLLGLFDLGYNMYSNTMVQGAIQEAARDSSIEGADTTVIDSEVSAAVRNVVPQAAITFSRSAYTDYSDVGSAEDFSDVNGDGNCNDGEPFEDTNGNGIWDSDVGIAGPGSARDVVLYTVIVEYPRVFPFAAAMGLPEKYSSRSDVVLRNQPFAKQEDRAAVGNCT